MPDPVNPEDLRVTNELHATGRAAFEDGAPVLENAWSGTGHVGRAWFAGWPAGPADRLDGGQRAVRAYPHLLADDRAELF